MTAKIDNNDNTAFVVKHKNKVLEDELQTDSLSPFTMSITDQQLNSKAGPDSVSLQNMIFGLQTVLEEIDACIFIKDNSGLYTYVNRKFKEHFYVSDENIIGKEDCCFFDGEHTTGLLSNDNQVLEYGRTIEQEEKHVLKLTMETRLYRTIKKPVLNEQGQIIGMCGIVYDITDHKLLESEQATKHLLTLQALKREAEKNRTLLLNASDGIHILDFDGNILEVSDSFCTMLGYRRDEMIGMNVSEWDAQFANDELLGRLRQQFENKIRSQFETRHRRKDGSVFDVEVSGFPLELDGKPILFNSSREITERKNFLDKLRQKERYQRALLDNFPFAVWLKDTESRFLSVNAGFVKIFGRSSAEELVGMNDFDIAPPELAEGYRADDVEVLTTLRNKNVEEKILTGGQLKWFETYKAPVTDDNGAILGTVGFSRDISERKQQEEKLHLAASVFTHAREGIMITEPDGTIIEVNNAFCHITGYSRLEVLGMNTRILKSDLQSNDYYKSMWLDLVKKGHWHGEIWNRRKDGTLFAEMLTISSVHDTLGKIRHYVALFTDITAIKEHENQLQYIAHYDALTSLPNRVLLAERMQEAMAQAQRHSHPLAVVYLDLDGFKIINDMHGHETGDKMLISVAKRMKRTLREGDTLARLGGDEFVAVLLDQGSIEASLPMLNRLLAASALPQECDNYVLQLSASLGVTFYPQEEDVDADQLLRQADQSMYQAKLAGKNRYHIFDAKQDSNIRGHHESLERIRLGLSEQEFVLYYQPKVNMRTGALIGVEALIRWQHPERGLLPPAIFLPVIENHPLAVEVGEWVIDTALTQMEQWLAAGLAIPVSINIGARQLQQANFILRLRELLSAHPQIKPCNLELEVVETSALEDVAQVSRLIETCREMGLSFSLDDFGTGYSSLTYLKRLPVNRLKIDQSFVRDMLDDPDNLAILEGVLGLANAFRRQVIAEGVETVAHGEMLLQFDCELAQGYGIARPMPGNQIPAWSVNWRPYPSWLDLPPVSREDLPLLFAVVEYRAWIAAIENHLSDMNPVLSPQNHPQSRFDDWLNTDGLARYGMQPAFETIKQLHNQAYALALELLELHAQNRSPEAQAGLGMLLGLRDALIEELKSIVHNNRK